MITQLDSKSFCSNNVSVIKIDEECTLYKLQDMTGEGTMTCFEVFPGIDLIYNDFNMQSCFSAYRPKADMIGIDHCRDGRIEWELQNGSYLYLKQGDMQINANDNHPKECGFPLSHYYGITIAIYVEEASKTLLSVMAGFEVNLQELYKKFCFGDKPFIMRAKDSIQHIFSELYIVPDEIRKNYFKIKVLELLLFLSVVDIPKALEERSYFPKNQVDSVKSIMKYITDNVDKHFTLDVLSLKFNIPLTSMKLCFKGVYGTSIYAFLRTYRIHTAALILRQTNENIISIAGKAGYDNASKFAAAFKDIMNVSPSVYRKNAV